MTKDMQIGFALVDILKKHPNEDVSLTKKDILETLDVEEIDIDLCLELFHKNPWSIPTHVCVVKKDKIFFITKTKSN